MTSDDWRPGRAVRAAVDAVLADHQMIPLLTLDGSDGMSCACGATLFDQAAAEDHLFKQMMLRFRSRAAARF